MTDFAGDTIGLASAWILTCLLVLYTLETIWFTVRGFRARLEDRWSAFSASLCMVGLVALFAWNGLTVFPNPFGPFLAVVGILALVNAYTFTLGRYKEKITRFTEQFGARMEPLLLELVPEERLAAFRRMAQFEADPEARRKTPHLLMGLFLAFYLFLGYFLLKGLAAILPAGIATSNMQAVVAEGVLPAGHVFSMVMLLGLLLILAPMEMVRLRFPELSYPFKSVILSSLRKKEAGSFGAHYYIAIALGLAALTLTLDPLQWRTRVPLVLAMIAVTVFADAASALVGKRWGQRKWFHNADKSYLGSVAGFVVAVAVALPFVSLPVALACGVMFVFIDFIGPVPIPVSDNILNPLGLGLLLYWL
ncbi:MAG: hypothetical protein ACPHK8_07045 [Thermoplasmatota archaeon]